MTVWVEGRGRKVGSGAAGDFGEETGKGGLEKEVKGEKS